MKRTIGILVILSVFCAGFLFAGSALGKSAGEKKAASDYKIVLILPGPINDQSWNATNYAGLVACNKELGTKMEYIENVQSGDFPTKPWSTFSMFTKRPPKSMPRTNGE